MVGSIGLSESPAHNAWCHDQAASEYHRMTLSNLRTGERLIRRAHAMDAQTVQSLMAAIALEELQNGIVPVEQYTFTAFSTALGLINFHHYMLC